MAGELTHTEEEAALLYCPQFKTGCMASKCMWWRWERVQWEENGPDRYVPVFGDRQRTGLGYCGVAGQP